MAGLVTKVIFAASTAGAVGGIYRLVSHYKNNTEPNSSVASTNNSEQGVTESSSSDPLEVETQKLQEESAVSQSDEHSREEERQEPEREVEVKQVEEGVVLSNSSPDLEQRAAEELPPPVTGSLETPSATDQSTSALREPVELGKCKVVSTSANILQSTITDQQDYYTIFCDNGDSGDVSLPSKWTGLFPKSIFKKDMEFHAEQQLNIELTTQMDEDGYSAIETPTGKDTLGVEEWFGMTAKSNKFSSETMTGYWGYKTFDDENSGAIILIDNSEIDQEIYLLFNQDTSEE